MIDISVDIDTLRVQERLALMQVRALDFRPVFERARLELQRANAANFATGGLPVGGWRPREEPRGWPLLRRTGKLFQSLVNLRGPDNIVTPKNATFGTDVEYAKFHQYGTEHMAKRQILFNPRTFSYKTASNAAAWVARGEIL